MSQTEEGAEISLTHTAKSKGFRYLKDYEIQKNVRNPDRIYHDTQRDTYLIPVEREQHRSKWNHSRVETVVIIVKPIEVESKYLVVTQTGDHYDWSDYEQVGELPEVAL